MSDQLTDSDLELIEARAKYGAALEHTILGSYIERHDVAFTGDDKIIIHRSTALWLVDSLRRATAEGEELTLLRELLEVIDEGADITAEIVKMLLPFRPYVDIPQELIDRGDQIEKRWSELSKRIKAHNAANRAGGEPTQDGGAG